MIESVIYMDKIEEANSLLIYKLKRGVYLSG